MPLPLIAASIAAGGLRAGIGLLQGRNETRRKRNQIMDAYSRGHDRLNIHQQDVRQSETEGLQRRGLTLGGDVRTGGTVNPGENLSVGGIAHTLGAQQQTDLHREQGLEQNDLLQQRDNAISDVNAEGVQNAIGSIASGIQTGFQVAGMGGGGSPSIASAYSAAGQHPYFSGADPVNPDFDSDWSKGLTNSGFTTYNRVG